MQIPIYLLKILQIQTLEGKAKNRNELVTTPLPEVEMGTVINGFIGQYRKFAIQKTLVFLDGMNSFVLSLILKLGRWSTQTKGIINWKPEIEVAHCAGFPVLTWF